jgi:hypothetical protein
VTTILFPVLALVAMSLAALIVRLIIRRRRDTTASTHQTQEADTTKTVTGSAASLARFRSLQRGIAVLVGLIPVVALHTVVPGVVPGVTVGDLVLFIAPAVVSVLGIAYAIRRLPVMWSTMGVSLAAATGLIIWNASEVDGSLVMIWWPQAYLVILALGVGGDAIYTSWATSAKASAPTHSSG